MTTSNRDAARNGKLGEDVLTMATRDKSSMVEDLDVALTAMDVEVAQALSYAARRYASLPKPALTLADLERQRLTLLFRHAPPFTGTDEERDALLATIAASGVVTLPPGFDFTVVEPAWPNPSSVEVGQIWEPGPKSFARHPMTVQEVDSDSALFSFGCVAKVALLDPSNGWRCVGYELPDGSRVMVGEWRELAPGRDPWRVAAVESDGFLALTRRSYERLWSDPEDLVGFPVVGAPPAHSEVKYTFVATGAEETAAGFKVMGDAANAAREACKRLGSVSVMRAECSASDVIEGEQDRTASPRSADCGPGFVRPVSPAIQAMIDAGYTVDPSLL